MDTRNCSNNCSKLPGLWILTVVNWTAERRDAGVCGAWDSRKIKYDIQLQRKRVNMKCHRVIIKSQQNFNNGSWYLSPKCVAFKMQNTKEHNTFVTQDNKCLHCEWWINTCIRYLEVYTMLLQYLVSCGVEMNIYLYKCLHDVPHSVPVDMTPPPPPWLLRPGRYTKWKQE